ncbi:hypothetical protein Cni_G23925 [Canna indica]|uniref:Uncharacterized protein n=1 Tax=Canna indica TaxID=4628 RepID=A0AAQ3KUS1_9LILI|nr:hypothetical protein Cni_G23925 [Canna indica]
MPQRPDVISDDGSSVKVGTTGTIGSLMTRELESMKHSEQASSSVQRKQQTGPVSVPCGANPKKALQKRNHTLEHGGNSSSINNNSGSTSGHTHAASHMDVEKPRHTPRKNGHRAPMLVSGDSAVDRNLGNDRAEKKAHTYFVEVVDIKCNNPMSNRLKKLGFSKLSESIS